MHIGWGGLVVYFTFSVGFGSGRLAGVEGILRPLCHRGPTCGVALLSGLVLDAGVLRASSVLVCLTLGLWGVCAASLPWAMSVRRGIGLVVGCWSIVVGVRSLRPWF